MTCISPSHECESLVLQLTLAGVVTHFLDICPCLIGKVAVQSSKDVLYEAAPGVRVLPGLSQQRRSTLV